MLLEPNLGRSHIIFRRSVPLYLFVKQKVSLTLSTATNQGILGEFCTSSIFQEKCHSVIHYCRVRAGFLVPLDTESTHFNSTANAFVDSKRINNRLGDELVSMATDKMQGGMGSMDMDRIYSSSESPLSSGGFRNGLRIG